MNQEHVQYTVYEYAGCEWWVTTESAISCNTVRARALGHSELFEDPDLLGHIVPALELGRRIAHYTKQSKVTLRDLLDAHIASGFIGTHLLFRE